MDILTLKGVIDDFLSSSPANIMFLQTGERIWDPCLVGVSRGDDPLYEAVKSDIGFPAMTPSEIFQKKYPERPSAPAALAVICYALPHSAQTKADNAAMNGAASERWCRSRVFGEACNLALARHLEEYLLRLGIRAISPIVQDWLSVEKHETYTFATQWSERHAAYISGLGTFSLCRGLITPVGKAVRLGSVIAELSIPATKRTYSSINEYCLYYFDGSCGACVTRCPQQAVTPAFRDKVSCRRMVYEHTPNRYGDAWGFSPIGCGLCQTRVPCENGIPAKIVKARHSGG